MPTIFKNVLRMALIGLLINSLFVQCQKNITGEDALGDRLLYSFSQGSAGFYYNPPTLAANHVYIGTSRRLHSEPAGDNYFFTLDLQLHKIWEYSLGAKEVRGSATVDNQGNVYFVVEAGRKNADVSESELFLYALDAGGNFKWSKRIMSSPGVSELGMSNPALAADGTVYVGGDKFYAFDATGHEQWTYGEALQVMNAPVIDPDGNIYFSTNGAVISLDAAGGERWRFDTSGECIASPAFATDYQSVFVPVGNRIYRLESGTGHKIWEFSPDGISGGFRATPAVDEENNVYAGTKADKQSVFYAIRADGSGLRWQNPVGADLYSSPALGADHVLYVGSEWSTDRQIHLHALDMQTGSAVWSASLAADVTWCSPALSPDGTVFIGTMAGDSPGGKLYAIRTDSPGLLPNAGSPRFHGGNASTGRREP